MANPYNPAPGFKMLKALPCSCGDGQADEELGAHTRYFEQVWNKKGPDGYLWKCKGCGKIKEGWERT